jgi:hypothetical protein
MMLLFLNLFGMALFFSTGLAIARFDYEAAAVGSAAATARCCLLFLHFGALEMREVG